MGSCLSSSSGGSAYLLTVSSAPPVPDPLWLALPSHLDTRSGTTSSSVSHRVHTKLLHSPGSTSLKDFAVEKVLGRGKFGEVVLARHSTDNKYYAVKQLLKTQIGDGRYNMDSVANEISCLFKVRHPFVSHLFGYFEDDSSCCLILEYCCGGELFNRLRRANSFPTSTAKFYFTEIALALDYLQSSPLYLVYRDLKPENVMLSNSGHVRLVDFGFAVRLSPSDQEGGITSSCGTAMYVAPEVASGHTKKKHGFPVDWWSLGVLLFEMLTGKTPFGDTADVSKFEVLTAITAGKVSFPFGVGTDARHIISGLLTLDPVKRFTFKDVKASPFMKDVDLDAVLNGQVRAPWSPASARAEKSMAEDKVDVANFLDWSATKRKDLGSGKTHPEGGGDKAAGAAAAADKLDRRNLPTNLYSMAVGASASGVIVAPGWTPPSAPSSSGADKSETKGAAGGVAPQLAAGAKNFASAGVAASGVLKSKKKLLKSISTGGGTATEGDSNDDYENNGHIKSGEDTHENNNEAGGDNRRGSVTKPVSIKKPQHGDGKHNNEKSPQSTHKKKIGGEHGEEHGHGQGHGQIHAPRKDEKSSRNHKAK